ncbi:hypothetical protein [Terrabacter sp. MAHUQ-38]|uniref:hypothetical protein n=1 Tax=unclassified Terrabacter TaxID=2630222 RepID=UPI00165D3AC2|nr:hypothetical protein [Terrabacter sp. MAHUQ-38]MBC9822743.1 hypothetical protein [Terrabacter sp. MAHUQ-38]
MSDSGDRRFKSVRASTRALLASGEQLNIEFKSEVPKNIANHAAAGANLVALDPNVDVYTVLVGVTEELTSNGTTRGLITGCVAKDGTPEDLDALRLRIEQMIRDSVVPPPQVRIFEENTSTTKPILVIEVTPTNPPHRVAEKYQVRGSAGLTALTQHDALSIFRSERTKAWIDELESSAPLLNVLQALHEELRDLSFRVSDVALGEEGLDQDDLQSGITTLEEALSSVEHGVHDAIRDVKEELSFLQSDVTDMANEPAPETAESVWWAVRQQREMTWLRLNTRAAFDGLSPSQADAIERVVREHLATEPDLTDFAGNLAELQAYRGLVSAELPDDLVPACRLVEAAIARAESVPRQFSADWIEEGLADRAAWKLKLEKIQAATANSLRPPRLRKGSYAREVGVMQLDPDGVKAIASHEFATTTHDSAATLWRSDEGALKFAAPATGSSVPVVYQGTWGSDTARLGRPKTSAMARALRKIFAQHGHSSVLFEGPGRVVPTVDG